MTEMLRLLTIGAPVTILFFARINNVHAADQAAAASSNDPATVFVDGLTTESKCQVFVFAAPRAEDHLMKLVAAITIAELIAPIVWV